MNCLNLYKKLKKNIRDQNSGFTLIEILMVAVLITVLSGTILISANPQYIINKTREVRTKAELKEIASAMILYTAKYGGFPPDVNRNLPNGLEEFLPGGVQWPIGPYPGSVYDWDNWENQTCWNGETGIVQITLRQVPGYDANDWTFYYIMRGKGVPHCSNRNTKGYCVNCPDEWNIYTE